MHLRYIFCFIYIVSFNISFSQCLDDCKKEVLTDLFKNAVYTGCLDDNDIPNGYGKMEMNDNSASYEGCWRYGKMEGEGLLIRKGLICKGFWKEGKMNGQGECVQFNENEDTLTQIGLFKNDIFFTGTETNKYADNIIITKEIKLGDLVSEKSNIKNYYEKKDIVGENGFTELKYIRRDNHFWLKMKIGDTEAEWIFDTGGSGLYIGKKLWDRMLENGVKYKDLLIEAESKGAAGGITKNKYVQIDEIILGNYKILNVIALVRYSQNNSLMGAQFYDKFSNVKWDMKEETVSFYR